MKREAVFISSSNQGVLLLECVEAINTMWNYRQQRRSKSARNMRSVSRTKLFNFKGISRFWMHEQQELISIHTFITFAIINLITLGSIFIFWSFWGTFSIARGWSVTVFPGPQNKKHVCYYFERGRRLCSAIYKIEEINSTRELKTSTVSVNIQHWNLACRLLKANTAPNAHYIVRCASVLAWCYVAGHLPEQLIIDLL